MRFEWGDKKAAANLRKHGVSFEEAAEVFNDLTAVGDYDPERSDAGNRFFVIGLSSRRLLYVVYAGRAEDMLRIISARRTAGSERKFYERARTR